MASESTIPENDADGLKTRPVVRILSSELDEEVRETLHGFVREAIGNDVWLETLLPESTLDGDLLKTAIDHHWDLAMIVVDKIYYPSNERGDIVIIKGGRKLIRALKQSFPEIPLICFYSKLDDSELSKVLLDVGAAGVFRLPCKSKELVPLLKKLLHVFTLPLPPPLPPPPPAEPPPSSTGLQKPLVELMRGIDEDTPGDRAEKK